MNAINKVFALLLMIELSLCQGNANRKSDDSQVIFCYICYKF